MDAPGAGRGEPVGQPGLDPFTPARFRQERVGGRRIVPLPAGAGGAVTNAALVADPAGQRKSGTRDPSARPSFGIPLPAEFPNPVKHGDLRGATPGGAPARGADIEA